jgi:hypothetical protein
LLAIAAVEPAVTTLCLDDRVVRAVAGRAKTFGTPIASCISKMPSVRRNFAMAFGTEVT